MTTRQILSRGALILLFALIVGGIAFVVSDSREREYSATTKLLFDGSTPEQRATGLTNNSDEEERAIVNNVIQVGSFDIARRTAAALDDRQYDADEIDRRVDQTAERGADIVIIEARAPSKGDASKIVKEYRHQFIRRAQEVVRSRAQRRIAGLEAALRDLSPRLRDGRRGDAIRDALAALTIVSRTGGEPVVVEGVRASDGPVSPNVVRDTLFGLLFGAILGVGLIALRGATTRTSQPSGYRANGRPDDEHRHERVEEPVA
jgi:capsular polysaccharide biosynthesis protein